MDVNKLSTRVELIIKLFLWGWVGGGWVLKMKVKLLKLSTKLKLKLKLKFGKKERIKIQNLPEEQRDPQHHRAEDSQ